MKKVIKVEDPKMSIFLLQPSRPIFCTTKNEDGSDHAAPFGWLMPISFNPPRVALSLQNERGQKYSSSLKNAMREREFVVNVPKMGMEFPLVQSSYMLENHSCKFDRLGSARIDSQLVKPKKIADCVAFLECKVYDIIDDGKGDHTTLLADIVYADFEEGCYDEMMCPVISKFKPILSLKEYRHPDHQTHVFLDPATEYEVVVPYEKPLS